MDIEGKSVCVSFIRVLFCFLSAGDKRLRSPVRLWSHKAGGEPPTDQELLLH